MNETIDLLVGLMGMATSNALTFHFHHGSRRNSKAAENRQAKAPMVKFAELGILASNVRMTHMVHLDDEELAALISSGASVAHCPQTALDSIEAGIWGFNRGQVS